MRGSVSLIQPLWEDAFILPAKTQLARVKPESGSEGRGPECRRNHRLQIAADNNGQNRSCEIGKAVGRHRDYKQVGTIAAILVHLKNRSRHDSHRAALDMIINAGIGG